MYANRATQTAYILFPANKRELNVALINFPEK